MLSLFHFESPESFEIGVSVSSRLPSAAAFEISPRKASWRRWTSSPSIRSARATRRAMVPLESCAVSCGRSLGGRESGGGIEDGTTADEGWEAAFGTVRVRSTPAGVPGARGGVRAG